MPEIARQLAKGVREFRRVQQHLTSELHGAMSELDFGDDEHGSTSTPGTRSTSASAVGDPVPSLPPKAGGEPDTAATNGHAAPSDAGEGDTEARDPDETAPQPRRNPPD
jgi:hypothetical protein